MITVTVTAEYDGEGVNIKVHGEGHKAHASEVDFGQKLVKYINTWLRETHDCKLTAPPILTRVAFQESEGN